MIDEGYDIEDIDEMFDDELIEEIIDEARVTMGRGDSPGVGKVTIGSGNRMAAKSRLDKRKAEKRAETVRKTKKAVRDVIDKPAREYAAKRKIVPSRSGKQKLNISNLEESKEPLREEERFVEELLRTLHLEQKLLEMQLEAL